MSKPSEMKNKKLSPTTLRLLCGEYLSSTTTPNNFLCQSGLVHFTSGPESTNKLFGLHFYAEITGINFEAYNALGITNLPLQMAVCYWLDRIGLLYRGGPRRLDTSRNIFTGSRYHHNVSSTPVVKLPAEFIPEKKFDYMKGPSRSLSCMIEIPSKFDPSILVLDEQQLCKMRHSALQKLDTKLVYLRDERVRAIALSQSKQPEWEDEKRELKSRLKNLKDSHRFDFGTEMDIRNLEKRIKSLKRKMNRKDAVIQKYFKNVQKHIVSLECDARDAETNVLRTREKILASKKRIEGFIAEMQELLKNELLGETESKRSSAKKENDRLRVEVEKFRQSIQKCEQEIPELESIARAFRFEATSIRKEMGCTIESFDAYLDIVQKQKEYENIELCQLKFILSDFDKNNDCILQLDELIKDVGSNLEQIQKVVEKNFRRDMSASFGVSSRMVKLNLGRNTHDIELSHYLHHLKEGTRKSDIKRIEEYIREICSNLTGWIASLSCLDLRVEQDLSKIRDMVKLYWRASFDVSTKKICLIHPTDKIEHLDIPEYVEYLRGKIRHFEEILAEKKRMCQ